MVLLAFGVTALGSLQAASGRAREAQSQRRTALSIAHEGIRIVQQLPYHQLVPTGGFVPPPWLGRPGAVAREGIAGGTQGPASTELARDRYDVAWKVEKVSGSVLIHRVHLRVLWRNVRGEIQTHESETMRAL